MAANEGGFLVIRRPWPSMTRTIWGDHERFLATYFAEIPGVYFAGDGARRDADGYVWVMGRVDDVINVAGHRLSTGAMEEVIATHPDVAECAVVGMADELKGQVPLGFVVLKAGVDRAADDIGAELVALMRERVGAVAAFKDTRVVARLPKTRSGKILRATMRAIADDQPYQVPSTIDDPVILDEIAASLGKVPR